MTTSTTTPPYGVISDCHLHAWTTFSSILPSGLNSRLQHGLDAIRRAGETVLAQGGKTLFITGDLFHVRGSVSPMVLNPTIDLFRELTRSGLKIVVLAGNHDLESRDSEALSNACEALRTIPGVTAVSATSVLPTEKVFLVPWFDSTERVRQKIREFADDHDAEEWTLMLHAPLNGVLIGVPDHGFWASELASYGFKKVFCGHHHNYRAFPGEVYSVGASMHQTWNDVGTKAGFMIVDDKAVTHYESEAPKFIDYDSDWDDDEAIKRCSGSYVRVRLGEATDEEQQLIRDHITGLGALGVVVQAIPVPKNSATVRSSAASKAPTVRQSIQQWINDNGKPSPELSALCEDILNEVEAVEE